MKRAMKTANPFYFNKLMTRYRFALLPARGESFTPNHPTTIQ